jgi:Cu(I)/Ag(I) efflux system membrane protein CusA/SilA
MAASAVLSIMLVPILMGFFIRGKITPEHKNPLNRLLIWVYRPFIHLVLKFRWITVGLAIIAVAVTYYPLKKLGSEFMPTLNEGDIFYMPMTLPGVSITSAKDILQLQDKILRTLPEAETVLGKIGRANTATDPAGLDMAETIVILKPMDKWRKGMTIEKLMEELDSKIKIPGVTNAWTMPIKTRIDMLATGIRTPVGIKVFGADLKTIDEVSRHIEEVIKQVPGTTSAYSVRLLDANYVDIDIHREEAARYGLTVKDVQDVIESAIGGMPITTTVEGRRRFPVAIRYANEYRDDLDALKRVLVPVPMGGGMEGGIEEMGSGMPMGMEKGQGGKMAMGKMGGGGMSSMGGGMSPKMPTMSTMPTMPKIGGMSSMGGGMSSMSGMSMTSPPLFSPPSTGGTAEAAMGGMSMTTTSSSMTSMGFGGRFSLPSMASMASMKPTSPPPLSLIASQARNFGLWRGAGDEATRLTQVPLGQLADITTKKGPMAILSENAMLTGTVYVDIRGRDIGSYVRDAKKAVAEKVKLPQGYYITWSGQYEYMMRAQARLRLIVPITLAVIFLLLYFNFKNITESVIVMLSLPFAVIGGIWIMYLLNFNMSIAVGVGFIALSGVAAETGVVMLVFLDLAYKKYKAEGAMTKEKLYDAIMEGAVLRVRPKMMTVIAIMAGLLPLFWGHGTGSEVMRRIAAPMIGGMVSSTILTLLVIPAIYAIWKGFEVKREENRQAHTK